MSAGLTTIPAQANMGQNILCIDTARAVVLWLQTQLPTEMVKGVDSQAAASQTHEWTL